MASKGLFMWELVVFLIGKHSMVTDHHLCQLFQSLPFVHGAAAVAAAVGAPRKFKKIRMTFIGNLDEKILMLLYLTYEKLTVSILYVT